MMKKLLILASFLMFALFTFAQTTSIATGDWNAPTTWDNGIPTSTSNATIVSPHLVTSTTGADAGAVVTIDAGATLTINSGATLTTSGNVVVGGTLNQNGICNVGDAVDDMFHLNGGIFALGNGSTTTISGYYKQQYVDGSNVGTISASTGTASTLNIANAGPLNDNVNNLFSIQDNCVASLAGATVNVNILKGNTGTVDEIFVGALAGIAPGNGTVTIGNGSNTTSNWSMVNNSSFGRVKLDIGSTNTLYFSHTVDRTVTSVIFNALNIVSGSFEIEAGKGLGITNNNGLTLGANGSLVLAGDASGSAEIRFSDDADDVEATINRYIVGDQWHQITPSTTGATTADVFQDYSPNVHLQEWIEGTQTWEFVVDPELDNPLNVGQGYMVQGSTVARANDFTISYTGNMESSDFTVSETLGSEEFALIGNPFSTAVRVIYDGFGMQDNVGLVDQIWVWDGANSQYATSTGVTGGTIPGGVVAQGQGFFIRSLTGWTGPVGMTILADQRQFSDPSYFLKSNSEIDWSDNHGKGVYVMLKVTDNEKHDGAFVNFGNNGTTAFEQNYDGIKSFGYSTSPQLYFIEGDLNLTIDYLKTLKEAEERVVTMHFKAGKDGEHKLAANLDSLPNVKVTLEDTKLSKMHEFNGGDYYTFNASTEDMVNRFLLHFMYSPTGIEDPVGDVDKSNIKIYSYNKAVYISNTESNTVPSSILMYDLMGREIYSNKLILESNTRIPVNVSNTYLIVKIINGNDVITQKVFIQ